MKKLLLFLFSVLFLISFSSFAGEMKLGETKVGGHLKMVLYDQPTGVTTVKSGSVVTSTASTSYIGMGFNEVILYISQELSDKFEIELKPKFTVSTGATPKLGTVIGVQRARSVTYTAGLDEAFVKYRAPEDVEIKAGVFKPMFTMNYGQELFWDEMFNAGKMICNPNLGQAHEMAVEIYKPFNFGEVSMPVYLYIINGAGSSSYYSESYISGNNFSMYPGAAAHVEPSWGPFTLSGSIMAAATSAGVNPGAQWFNFKGNANFHKWSAGASVNWQAFKIRGEYVRGKWEKGTVGAKIYDAISEGYYATVVYRLLPDVTIFAQNDTARSLNFNGGIPGAKMSGTSETYITNTAGLNYFITDSSILQFQVDVADWRNGNGTQTLIFTRPTLGLRVTF